MTKPTRKTPVVFYRSSAGAEVLRDWLRELAPADRNVIGQDLMRAPLAGRHAIVPTVG